MSVIAPLNKDHVVYKGATWFYKFRLKSSKTGVARNLIGYKARMKVKTSKSATGHVLYFGTSENTEADYPITIDVADDSLVTLGPMTAEETAAITQTRDCVYDLELVSAGDEPVERIMEGTFVFSGEVTTTDVAP